MWIFAVFCLSQSCGVSKFNEIIWRITIICKDNYQLQLILVLWRSSIGCNFSSPCGYFLNFEDVRSTVQPKVRKLIAARPIHRAVSWLCRTRPETPGGPGLGDMTGAFTLVKTQPELRAQPTWVSLVLFLVELSLWHKIEPLTPASVKGTCWLSPPSSAPAPHPHFIRDVPQNHVGPVSKYSQFGLNFWRLLRQRGVGSGVSKLHTMSLLTTHSSPSIHTQDSLWPPEALVWDINIS